MHTFTNSLDLSLRFGTEVAVHDDRLDLGVGDDVHIPHGVVAALHATNKGDHLCAITMRRKNEHEVGSDRDNPHQSWWQGCMLAKVGMLPSKEGLIVVVATTLMLFKPLICFLCEEL